MKPRTLPARLREESLRALYRQGLRWNVVESAFAKWSAHAGADPCRYGKEGPIALDCRCPGCIDRLCFLYFDQVLQMLR